MIEDMYQENILDHYQHPRHFGHLEGAQHTGREVNALCGDQLSFEIKEEGGKATAMFTGKGCAISQASASMLAELAYGKTLPELRAITQEDVLGALGIAISPARLKCALLSWATLRKALAL